MFKFSKQLSAGSNAPGEVDGVEPIKTPKHDTSESKAARAEKRRERKRLKKREKNKRIIREQRKMQKERQRETIEATLKLKRIQKARRNWLKKHAEHEEELMTADDPLAVLQRLRAELQGSIHPAFRGFDSSLRTFYSVDVVNPVYCGYATAASKKARRGGRKMSLHPAMPLPLPPKTMCDVSLINPVFYAHDIKVKNPDEDELDSSDEDPFAKEEVKTFVSVPPDTKKNRFCPICAALPKRIGLDGCPACYHHSYDSNYPLPWLRDARTLPGIQQGFRNRPVRKLTTPLKRSPEWDSQKTAEYVEFVKKLRRRRNRQPPPQNLTPIREKINLKPLFYSPPVCRGAATDTYGDLGKTDDDVNAAFVKHTIFCSRSAIEIYREQNQHRVLHIIIKCLPDDETIHLYVHPQTCTTEDLNRLVVMNCKDYEVGMCSDGRFQSLVLVIPTVKGVYHIDMRTFPPKDLHGIDIYSVGSNTALSEMKIQCRHGREEKLIMLRVPILSEVAIPRLLQRYFAANLDMLHVDVSFQLLRDKMFEVHDSLPGNDYFQEKLADLIWCQTRAKEEAMYAERRKKEAYRKALIKKLKLEEQERAQENERKAMKLIIRQEQERLIKKALKEEEERRKEAAKKKKEEDAARLKDLLALAGRGPQNSRPSTSGTVESSNKTQSGAVGKMAAADQRKGGV
jgi:hypothetical protein